MQITQTGLLTNCVQDILYSVPLQGLIATLLKLGNVVNSGRATGNATGFSPSSLTTFTDFKETVGNCNRSAVDYVVSSAMSLSENTFIHELEASLKGLTDRAVRTPISELVKEQVELSQDIKLAKKQVWSPEYKTAIENKLLNTPAMRVFVSTSRRVIRLTNDFIPSLLSKWGWEDQYKLDDVLPVMLSLKRAACNSKNTPELIQIDTEFLRKWIYGGIDLPVYTPKRQTGEKEDSEGWKKLMIQSVSWEDLTL